MSKLTQRPILLLVSGAVLLVGCSDSPTGPADAIPTIVALTPAAPPTTLFQSLDVELDGSASVEVDYWTPGGPRLRVISPEAATAHTVKLHQLRAASTYDFLVTPVGAGGARGVASVGQFSTAPLPAALAAIQTNVVGQATFPLLMMEVSLPSVTGVPIVMDRDGYIVWYRPGATA
ncbi:MAG: hypothetical protein OEO79_05980, partial [Gemmatimonadota bacterium]|nr:hypothetical protein [Gemmatimonadota bacterium]